MDVPIKHIVGTVALIGLIISVGLAYSVITSYVETDVRKQQLRQIAENVALNVVEIANLVNFQNLDATRNVTRLLDLPADVSGRGYSVQLVDASQQEITISGEEQNAGYYVLVNLTTDSNVYAYSALPVNSSQSHLAIVPSMVYGGTSTVVVWGCKYVVFGTMDVVNEVGITRLNGG